MRALLAIAAAIALVATGLTTAAPPAEAVDALETARIAGADRYATAVEADRALEPAGGPVFLASGATFPDALAAAPVVAAEGGHLLLTRPGQLPTVVAERIRELAPSEIVVVGSEASVAAAVVDAAVAAAGTAPTVERLGGAGRVETSLLLLQRLRDLGPAVEHIWIASGKNFPDALVAASVAGLHGHAVVLNHHGGTTAARNAWMALVGPAVRGAHVSIAGGEPSVSAADATALRNAGALSVNRYAGSNRYETAVEINRAWGEAEAETMLLATGANFPDALAGAALSGFTGAPLYLTPTACHPSITPMLRQEATELGVELVVGLGSTASVSEPALRLASCPLPLRQQIAQTYGSFATQRYSGTGNRVIDLGRTISYAQVVASLRGTSFVGLDALDSNRRQLTSIAFGHRTYSGTSLLARQGEQSATRFLQVEAQGTWSIEVRDLTSAPLLPGSTSGTSDAVYLYEGPATTVRASGPSSNRELWITQLYGNREVARPLEFVSLPATVPLAAGPSVIGVRATAPWSLQLR